MTKPLAIGPSTIPGTTPHCSVNTEGNVIFLRTRIPVYPMAIAAIILVTAAFVAVIPIYRVPGACVLRVWVSKWGILIASERCNLPLWVEKVASDLDSRGVFDGYFRFFLCHLQLAIHDLVVKWQRSDDKRSSSVPFELTKLVEVVLSMTYRWHHMSILSLMVWDEVRASNTTWCSI